MSAPTRARKRTLMRPLIYMSVKFLGMIWWCGFQIDENKSRKWLNNLWVIWIWRKCLGAQRIYEGQTKSLYPPATRPSSSNPISLHLENFAGFLCQIARVIFIFTEHNALIVPRFFASVMQVFSSGSYQSYHGWSEVCRIQGHVRTRSWHQEEWG